MVVCIVLSFMEQLFTYVRNFYQYLLVSNTTLSSMAWNKRRILALVPALLRLFVFRWMLFSMRSLLSVILLLLNPLVFRFSHVIFCYLRRVCYRSPSFETPVIDWGMSVRMYSKHVSIGLSITFSVDKKVQNVFMLLFLGIFFVWNTMFSVLILGGFIFLTRELQSFRMMKV